MNFEICFLDQINLRNMYQYKRSLTNFQNDTVAYERITYKKNHYSHRLLHYLVHLFFYSLFGQKTLSWRSSIKLQMYKHSISFN